MPGPLPSAESHPPSSLPNLPVPSRNGLCRCRLRRLDANPPATSASHRCFSLTHRFRSTAPPAAAPGPAVPDRCDPRSVVRLPGDRGSDRSPPPPQSRRYSEARRARDHPERPQDCRFARPQATRRVAHRDVRHELLGFEDRVSSPVAVWPNSLVLAAMSEGPNPNAEALPSTAYGSLGVRIGHFCGAQLHGSLSVSL